ncbi:F-box/FBD/LRR-repeat protein At1g13570-like isoform X2 [Lycium ferocissimum]|nr:F-box/FBD/LRR-repeat protein At1g13570-like isoform X2 [Lycium ferocissimum]
MAAAEMDKEDRISYLPRNVIDRILELLPVEDAARTSILSTKWRYIWAMLPNLVLDKPFCKKVAARSDCVFNAIVDKILLQHLGDVLKFDLDVSAVQCPDIDRWMLYVTRNGVKKLKLNMSKDSTFKVPSYIFNCPTLTKLKLFNCVFKPPKSFRGFPNLTTLYLEKVTFVSTTEIINVSLVNLTLMHCNGTQYLNIVSAGLKSLYYCESHCNLDLNCFINCKKLTYLYLEVLNYSTPAERLTLEKLLLSLTTLEKLTLCSQELELLSAGAVPKGLPFTLNCLWHLHLGVDLGQIGQTYYALELIKSFPNLSKLEIWVQGRDDIVEADLKYIDAQTCLDRPLNKLKDVTMHYFVGSKAELFFIKLLLARTPSLERMSIEPAGSLEEWNIAIELMRFPRASPKAELWYLTNVD